MPVKLLYDWHGTKNLPTAVIISSLMFYSSWPLVIDYFWVRESSRCPVTGWHYRYMKTSAQEEIVPTDQLLHSSVTARSPEKVRLHVLNFYFPHPSLQYTYPAPLPSIIWPYIFVHLLGKEARTNSCELFLPLSCT